MPLDGVLGIVGCYGISDQILHLIDRDVSIDNLFVVDNPEGMRFMKKMGERPLNKVTFPAGEDCLLDREGEDFSVLLWLNPEDLHNEPSAIQRKQDEILSRLSKHVASLFFCYGLCRSSEQRINNLIKQAPMPITFLTDAYGEIVDDCFAAILGGKRAYLDTILRNKGALFATTGYVEAWNRKHEPMDVESMVYEVEQLRGMFEALEYHRIIMLDDGRGDPASFEKDVRAFSRTFNMELEIRRCRLRVFERSYDLAKEKMNKGKNIEVQETLAVEANFSKLQAHESAWSLLGRIG